MASPLPLEELWQSALVNYGLERPAMNVEIHVFRVILQTSLDKEACTRSVTPAGPMSDPVQTLEQIIEEWYDLEVETQNHSWKLTPVNEARSWSPNKDLLNPVYVLTRNGDPFHLTRPQWGLRSTMGGEKLDHCACPPKVAELLSLCWSPSKCMWANACAKLCHVVR